MLLMRAGKLFAPLALLVALCGELHAQTPSDAVSSAAACPAGNLIAGRKPSHWADIRGRVEQTTDGVVSPEGAIWDAPLAVVLDTGASTLTWDLGAPTPVNVAWVQADANDYYTVWGSLDGREFRDLGRIDTVEGHGLRARKVHLGGAVVRYVRFGEGQGDNYYSLSEIQVFCQEPASYPPPVRVEKAQAAAPSATPFWNDETSARWELFLALVGFALLHWGYVLRREKRADEWKTLRDWTLAALGLLAAVTYINFFSFHFGNFIHDWEWTHYYVGSKYFKELRYDKLYECMSIADVEDGLKRRVELRKITNLRTNALESTKEVIENPQRCKQTFSAERWAAFKHDVRFFRGRQSAKRWDDLQTDHGYNGTPVWNVAGTLLANTHPASNGQLYTLASLDMLYLLGTIAVVWWAFGWRVLCVGLLVFATNFPSRFYWTGGSFLRWDWLFYTVAAICCLKKDRHILGGAALAYATLLRIFPGFVFVGPLLGIGWHFYKHRKLELRYTRFFAGAALAVALLVPTSFAVSGGVDAYKQFVQNTVKHKETPLTNYMGLRTMIAWRPSSVGRLIKDDKQTDPWGKWKRARLDAWKQAMPLYAVAALAFLALIGLAARHAEPWMAAALGVTFIPIGVELTCYYYAFIMGVALLHAARDEVGPWLLLLTAFTQFAAWAPLPGMAKWLDEQYTLMSVATVAVFGTIVWLFREPLAAALEPKTVADGGPGPSVETPASEAPRQRQHKKKKRR